MRRLNAAAKVVGELSPERRRLLAMRAAFGPRTASCCGSRRIRSATSRRSADALVAAELDQAGLHRGSVCGVRILERLDELAALGDRIGYSPEEDAAHELAPGWFEQAGLESRSMRPGT